MHSHSAPGGTVRGGIPADLPGFPAGIAAHYYHTGKSTGREAAVEQIILREAALPRPARSSQKPLPSILQVENGRPSLYLGDTRLLAADPYTLLFRAPTDNDVDLLGRCAVSDFTDQREEVLEMERTPSN